jgi:hypothetical protein
MAKCLFPGLQLVPIIFISGEGGGAITKFMTIPMFNEDSKHA